MGNCPSGQGSRRIYGLASVLIFQETFICRSRCIAEKLRADIRHLIRGFLSAHNRLDFRGVSNCSRPKSKQFAPISLFCAVRPLRELHSPPCRRDSIPLLASYFALEIIWIWGWALEQGFLNICGSWTPRPS